MSATSFFLFWVGINKRPRAERVVSQNVPPAPPISMLIEFCATARMNKDGRLFISGANTQARALNIEIGGAGGAFTSTVVSARGRLFIPTRNTHLFTNLVNNLISLLVDLGILKNRRNFLNTSVQCAHFKR